MVWETALAFFLLSLTVFIYLAVPVLFNLKSTLKKASRTLDILNKDLPDILDNVSEIGETVNGATKKIESTVEDLAELEQLVSKEIKQPLQNVAQSIASLLSLANKIFDRRSKK